MENPYSLVFGIEPSQYISRLEQTEEIVNGIKEDPRCGQLQEESEC